MLFIFSLQLCVNVQIPKNLRGLGAGAVYVDTNRGFSIERIKGSSELIFMDYYIFIMDLSVLI